MKILQWR